MGNHKCVIGLFNQYEGSYLCNLDDLKRQIHERNEFINSLLSDPVYGKIGNPGVKCWTLKEYADKRRSTDLTRFNYCPECGKRIDWAALKEEK